MEIANQIRGYRFLLGVFRHQQADPFCGRCSALANTLRAAQDRLEQFSDEQAATLGALSVDLRALLAQVQEELPAFCPPEQPAGQKKAGNCKLSQGVCFIKASWSLLQQV